LPPCAQDSAFGVDSRQLRLDRCGTDRCGNRSLRQQLIDRHPGWHAQTMKRYVLLCALAGLGLSHATSGAAQDSGRWRAASKTARSITGDVAISNSKLSIDFAAFPIAQIRSLSPAEVAAVFDVEAATAGSGNLYRLNVPAAKKFLHKNTLCGADDAQWLVTYAAGHDLQIAFFSQPSMPIFTPEAIANTTNLCGTYSYVK
jgi:hypothetical protein